jgi:hypothetical protein
VWGEALVSSVILLVVKSDLSEGGNLLRYEPIDGLSRLYGRYTMSVGVEETIKIDWSGVYQSCPERGA